MPNNVSGVTVSLKMAERVEELREWKRKQSYTFGAITEQNGLINRWSEYLKRNHSNIKLMNFVPMKSHDVLEYNLEYAAKTMIERAVSGEYNQWKSLKD